ncbi:MAG: response regulator transcription factor [Propionibacteriaceae bacterium]|jgi:two-component system response regulator QseB|nr:response regulator transcription factor [Propionibacteriaceae bacterium]
MDATLLFIEDDPSIAEMVIEVLRESYDVDHAATGEAGLDLALRKHYDLMVIDRRLPGMDGVAVIAAVRRARITTPVLMLTALGTVEDRVSGLDGGANDYLVKPFDFDELLARLRALRRGFTAEGQRRYIGTWLFTPDTHTLYSPYDERISLTATESALLSLLTESPEHVFSREEILSAVFSSDDTPGTVDTYVHYIRRKADYDLIETVRARGYRLGEPL